jgi:hypothetical protein
MADGVRSKLFDFLDDIAARDVAEGRPRTWADGRCPKCRQLARHGLRPADADAGTTVSRSTNVTWVCLNCGVFQAPLAA